MSTYLARLETRAVYGQTAPEWATSRSERIALMVAGEHAAITEALDDNGVKAPRIYRGVPSPLDTDRLVPLSLIEEYKEIGCTDQDIADACGFSSVAVFRAEYRRVTDPATWHGAA